MLGSTTTRRGVLTGGRIAAAKVGTNPDQVASDGPTAARSAVPENLGDHTTLRSAARGAWACTWGRQSRLPVAAALLAALLMGSPSPASADREPVSATHAPGPMRAA